MVEKKVNFFFSPDEIYMDQKLDGVSENELLNYKTGLYKVTEVEKVLKLAPGTLRTLAQKQMKRGKSPYREWGIGNSEISHWIVRMKVFSKVWEKEIKPLIKDSPQDVKPVPKKISPAELCKLDGNFKLSELKGKFPFSHQSIKNQARKLGEESKSVMGCWKDGSQFYVNMQSFLKWLSSHKYK